MAKIINTNKYNDEYRMTDTDKRGQNEFQKDTFTPTSFGKEKVIESSSYLFSCPKSSYFA